MTKRTKATPEDVERIRKAAKKGIEWNPDVKINQHREQVNLLKRKIAELFFCSDPEDVDDWLKYCFVSDDSRLGDFLHDEDEAGQLQKLSEALGFPVESRNYIWEVALRMKPAS